MIIKILLLIVVLFLDGIQAQNPWKLGKKRRFRRNGVPANVSELCMKDLLLIVDTSNSVRAYFESDMKPFLKLLVKDRELRVSVNGTQIALMIFSEKEKTEVKLGFRVTYDAEGLAKFIDDLKWDDVKGGFTRTDYAFELANEKVFPEMNPKNNRPDVPDVVVIITDGNPWGIDNILNITIKKANLIKEKGIEIVGAAVGSKGVRNEFKPKLEKMVTSPEHIVEADYKDINSIRSKLIENTCKSPMGKMCGDKVFFPASQECCCGAIHNKETGYECCGPKYYKTTDYKCCDVVHLVSSEEICPTY
mgnify:CR=1 FL=1